MRKFFLLISLIAGLLAISCKNNSTKAEEGHKSTIINVDGHKLDILYDKSGDKAVFVFQGDTIRMKRDTTASGLRFSNEHYIYIEHQGNMELTKDGTIVFEHQLN
jgi:membrane-bound inhibitor of C-type lysozyme